MSHLTFCPRRACVWSGVGVLLAALLMCTGCLGSGGAGVRLHLPGQTAGPDAAGPVVPRGTAVVSVLLSGRPSSVAVMNASTGAALGVVRLRSAAYDMATDVITRSVVTAQAGDVGQDSDDRLGVIDLDDGTVRYVRLPWPNPAFVSAADGKALVVHGVESDSGLRACVVDLASRSVVATGTVPSLAGEPFSAGAQVYLPVMAPGGVAAGAGTLWRLDMSSLELVESVPLAFAGGGMGAVTDGPVVLGGSPMASGPGRAALAMVARIDPALRTAPETWSADVAHGVAQVAAYGDDVAVLDAESSASPGGIARVVLPSSDDSASSVPVSIPAAIAGGSKGLYVVDGHVGTVTGVRWDGTPLFARRLDASPIAVGVSVLE